MKSAILLLFLIVERAQAPDPPAEIYVYASSDPRDNGGLGSRSTTTSYCESIADAELGPTLAAQCSYTPAMLCYTGGDDLASFPATYGFDAASSPVKTPTAAPLSSSFATFISGAPTPLTVSFQAASIVPGDYYTGCTTTGTTNTNCNDWLATAAPTTAEWGNYLSTGPAFLNAANTYCSNNIYVNCMCIISGTHSPTAKPTTLSPTTAKPTTVSPTPPTPAPTTKSPTGTGAIYFYSDDVAYGAVLSSRAAATTFCTTTIAPSIPAGVTCSTATTLMNYAGSTLDTFPELYGFSPSAIVKSATDITIGPWNTLFSGSGGLTNSLSSAGVATGNYWTGSTSTGTASTSCSYWTTSGFAFGRVGSVTSTTDTWINSASALCSQSFRRVCVCVTGSARPTANPTNKPTTKTPTTNPTTKSPTNNPTTNPTVSPTRFPTFHPTPLLRRWRLSTGSVATSTRAGGQAALEGTKIDLISTQLEAVLWENLVWDLLGDPQPAIASCNPIPTTLPGGVEYDQLGRRICPALITCTSDTGPPFTTLRACVTSYSVVVDEGPSPPTDFVFIEGELDNGGEAVLTGGTSSVLLCNSAIERELNCQFKRQDPAFILQCQSEPINCYQNETLGYAFGLFEMQNPLFPYDIPVGDWTETHYHGIASILNNLTYSLEGRLVDPLTSQIMNDYYWLPDRVFTTESLNFSMRIGPDTLQAQPYNLFDNLPPTPWTEEFYTQYDGCIAHMTSTGNADAVDCQELIWEDSHLLRQPGASVFFTQNPTATGTIQFIGVEHSYTFEGVEFYTEGVLVYQNLTRSQTYTIPMSTAIESGDAIRQSYIRLLGVAPTWDIPGARLSPLVPTITDTLWPLCDLGPFANPFYPLTSQIGVTASLLTDTTQSDFPHRASPFTLTPQEVIVTYYTTPGEADWTELSRLILEENTYPTNNPLLDIQSNYETAAINLSSPTHQDYLYRIWSTHLARRRSSEPVDCLTRELGNLVFNSSLPARYWTMAQTTAYDLPPGAWEGGCACDDFYDPLTGCSTCLPGLGPLSTNCSLPFTPDPQPGQPESTCAGHGTPTETSWNPAGVGRTEFYTEGIWVFPLCTSLLFLGEEYALNQTSQGGVAFIYVNGLSLITVVQSTLYLNNTLTAYTVTQTAPYTTIAETPVGDVYCSEGPRSSNGWLLAPALQSYDPFRAFYLPGG